MVEEVGLEAKLRAIEGSKSGSVIRREDSWSKGIGDGIEYESLEEKEDMSTV
jgi:hypothetical protein